MMKHSYILLATLVALAGCDKGDALPPAIPADAAAPVPPAISQATVTVRSYADSVEESGWFLLDRSLIATTTARHRCAIERVNGEKPISNQPIVIAAGAALAFNGWTSDAELRSPTRFLFVLDDGDHAYALNGTTGRQRTDVSSALQSEGAVQAGFYVKSVLTDVPPGTYALKVLGEAGSQYSVCTTPASLAVDGT